MSWSNIWPSRWFRAKNTPTKRIPSTARLAVETLEDRVVPSTTYANWKTQTFTVDDAKIASVTVAPTASVASPTNASFGSLIGLTSAFNNYSYRGDGYSVAIIDTGIDYTHANLGGGFGAGHRVIAGYDFVNKDSNPIDDNGHGTHVAGIVGSSSTTYSGIAPNVNLIALKVLDANGSGSYGNVELALQWVAANQAKYNIVAINMSLGSGNYSSNPYTFLEDEFSSLKAKGVFLALAAGNSFYGNSASPGLGYPATSPNVVSVGAVWNGNFGPVAWGSGARDNSTANDRLTSFSQRSSALSILAPGALITSTYLNNTMQAMAGTSMASPVIAGAAVLIHQAMDARGLTANQTTILSTMKNTGVTVKDGDDEDDNVTNTGLSFKRLNLSAALNSLGTPTNAAPVLQTIANQTVAAGGSRVITLSATDPDGDAITYIASLGASATTASASQAYQWKQTLGLTYAGSYYTNSLGSAEKWLSSSSGTWYCLMPNGDLRRWAGSMTSTLLPANLLVTFDASYYADPSKLWDATPSTGPTVSILGNQLTIQSPAGALPGTYSIQVTATDGSLASSKTFTLTIQGNTGPQIGTIADVSMLAGRSQTITLTASQSATFNATILGTFAARPASIALVGNQLTIHSSPDFAGSFDVRVTASNGSLTTATTFKITVAAASVAFRLKGDFNGDRVQDTGTFNSDGTVWVSLKNIDGTFANQKWAGWAIASNWSSVQAADFNGDGKTDLIAFAKAGNIYAGISSGAAFSFKLLASWSAAETWALRTIGDFNGDGKTDILCFANNGKVTVGLSTGSAIKPTAWGNWGVGSGWTTLTCADIDGDGKLDLVGKNTLGNWTIGYSTGTSFRMTLWTGAKAPV